MGDEVKLTIPVPPTDTRYYGKPKGMRHKYLTKAAKVFRHEVAVIAMQEGARGAFPRGRVNLRATLHLGSGGDIQNRLKGLCDALEHAEVLGNDRQIDELIVIRGHPVTGGRCEVTLRRR